VKRSWLKSSARSLVSSYPTPEPFIVQAPTVLRTTPVDFPYTAGLEAANFKFSNRARLSRALSDTLGNNLGLLLVLPVYIVSFGTQWCPMVLAQF
jgi:hypothetical protein